MVLLKDISERCGVSVATVSKALNGHKDVSRETREKLIKVAKEMGYFPNSQARALKTKRTYNLGVMFIDEAGSGLTQEFFAKLLNSFKIESESLGYDITFIGKDTGSRKMTAYEHCKYRNVDGVLIACTDFTSQDVYEIINGDIPVVTIDHSFENRPSVMSDNQRGMEELVNYAVSRGHRKLALIQGNKSSVAEGRLAGFIKVCKRNKIEIRQEWLLSGDYHNPDSTYRLTKQLLQENDRPTCIFMPDDYSALGGLNAIYDLNLSVPDHISIVGYDGIKIAGLLSPKLTTYAQDTEKIGKEAAKKLISLIENSTDNLNEVINVRGRLIEGESVKEL